MTPRIVESPAFPDGGPKGALVPDGHSPRKRAIAWLATTIGLVAIGLASLLLGGIYRFGSAASALAYLRGDRLIPDTYTKTFGTVGKDEGPSVGFTLTNYTEQAIKVLGANASCTCLVASDMPIVVPPGGSAILRQRPGEVRSRAVLRIAPRHHRSRG